MESKNYIEVLQKPSHKFAIKEKCYWTKKHKYLVEIKNKEEDLCEVLIIKESPTDKCHQSFKLNHKMWVFCKDLIKI